MDHSPFAGGKAEELEQSKDLGLRSSGPPEMRIGRGRSWPYSGFLIVSTTVPVLVVSMYGTYLDSLGVLPFCFLLFERWLRWERLKHTQLDVQRSICLHTH